MAWYNHSGLLVFSVWLLGVVCMWSVLSAFLILFTCGSVEGDVAKVSQLRAFSHRHLHPWVSSGVPWCSEDASMVQCGQKLCVHWTPESHLREFWLSLLAFLLQFYFMSTFPPVGGKGWQTNTLSPASKDHTLAFLKIIAVNNLLQGVQICFPALLRQQPKNSNQLVIMPVRVTSKLRTAVLNKSQLVFYFFKFFFIP